MSLHRLRILQIGDVHYSEAIAAKAKTDTKDPTFNHSTLAGLSTPPFQSVIRRLLETIKSEQIDIVAVMGDITDRGDEKGLDAGLAQLKAVFENSRVPNSAIHFVPGNHDIKRLGTHSSADTRFDELISAMTKHGFKFVAPEQPSIGNFSSGPAEIKIACINTCFGCGTKRNYPDIVSDAITKAIDDEIKKNAGDASKLKRVLSAVYEMDTPAIHDDVLQVVSHEASFLDGDDVMVVAGHHNILPQKITRIAPYTELVNAGQFRNNLLSYSCNVIYLHGHVHDDPIEVISSPDCPSTKLVLIGAPLLNDGFNLVEVAFSSAGVALGCVVKKYRMNSSSQIHISSSKQISFWKERLSEFGALSCEADEISRYLRNSERRYFRDIASHYAKAKLEGEAGDADSLVRRTLEELWWLGVVQIDHLEKHQSRWVVRNVI